MKTKDEFMAAVSRFENKKLAILGSSTLLPPLGWFALRAYHVDDTYLTIWFVFSALVGAAVARFYPDSKRMRASGVACPACGTVPDHSKLKQAVAVNICPNCGSPLFK